MSQPEPLAKLAAGQLPGQVEELEHQLHDLVEGQAGLFQAARCGRQQVAAAADALGLHLVVSAAPFRRALARWQSIVASLVRPSVSATSHRLRTAYQARGSRATASSNARRACWPLAQRPEHGAQRVAGLGRLRRVVHGPMRGGQTAFEQTPVAPGAGERVVQRGAGRVVAQRFAQVVEGLVTHPGLAIGRRHVEIPLRGRLYRQRQQRPLQARVCGFERAEIARMPRADAAHRLRRRHLGMVGAAARPGAMRSTPPRSSVGVPCVTKRVAIVCSRCAQAVVASSTAVAPRSTRLPDTTARRAAATRPCSAGRCAA